MCFPSPAPLRFLSGAIETWDTTERRFPNYVMKGCTMNTDYLPTGNSPSQPNDKPLPNSSQVHDPEIGCQIPPPETLIAVPPMSVGPLVTTRQAAAILLMSRGTLEKWRRTGKGPQFIRHPNGSIRYLLRSVLKFLKDRTVQTKQATGRKRRTRNLL